MNGRVVERALMEYVLIIKENDWKSERCVGVLLMVFWKSSSKFFPVKFIGYFHICVCYWNVKSQRWKNSKSVWMECKKSKVKELEISMKFSMISSIVYTIIFISIHSKIASINRYISYNYFRYYKIDFNTFILLIRFY